jgi:hypothetical protein
MSEVNATRDLGVKEEDRNKLVLEWFYEKVERVKDIKYTGGGFSGGFWKYK